jgi:hypothetical protein
VDVGNSPRPINEKDHREHIYAAVHFAGVPIAEQNGVIN